MTKKLLLGLTATALLFVSSCKKDDSALPADTWSVNDKKFVATAVTASPLLGTISAVMSNNSIDVNCKSLPASNADLTVNDEPYTQDEVAVRAVLSGNIVYNSINGNGAYVSVRVADGKYSVIMNNIAAVNIDNPLDTVRISANISEN